MLIIARSRLLFRRFRSADRMTEPGLDSKLPSGRPIFRAATH